MATDLTQWMMFWRRRWPRAAWATSSAVHGIGRTRADVQEQRALGLEDTRRRIDPLCGPAQVLVLLERVLVGVVADAHVVGRGGDDDVDARLGQAAEQIAAVREVEPSFGVGFAYVRLCVGSQWCPWVRIRLSAVGGLYVTAREKYKRRGDGGPGVADRLGGSRTLCSGQPDRSQPVGRDGVVPPMPVARATLALFFHVG